VNAVISTSILIVFLAVNSLSAQPVNALDLMKISEVMGAAEPEATQKLSGSVSKVVGTEYSGFLGMYVPFTGGIQLGDYEMIAIFQFGDKSGLLEQVLIRPVQPLPSWRRDRIAADLRSLVSMLFGEPTYDASAATSKDKKDRRSRSTSTRRAP
jgi:hypothetical protein